MPYFPSSQASGVYPRRLPQLLQAFGAWTLSLGLLAVVCMATAGGRFAITWHSGAAAGPILAFVPESFLDAGILTVILYLVSLGAAMSFQFLKFSWLWLGGWIASGTVILLMRLAYHFST